MLFSGFPVLTEHSDTTRVKQPCSNELQIYVNIVHSKQIRKDIASSRQVYNPFRLLLTKLIK